MQILTFHFNFLKINLIVALKIHFIFLTSMCNFIATKYEKKNDDENILNNYFN